MVKKFLPASLKGSKGCQYLEFWQTSPENVYKRHRLTFNINRIKDRKERMRYISFKLAEINALIPLGFPHNEIKPTLNSDKNICDAFEKALEIHYLAISERSKSHYKSAWTDFNRFLKANHYTEMRIKGLSKLMAIEYSDTLMLRGVSGKTHNGYVGFLKTLCNVLLKREYLTTNPFCAVDRKPQKETERRNFTEQERKVLFEALKTESPVLYFGAVMQYACLIRPAEIARLRKNDFDLDRGLINCKAGISKNGKTRAVTIPSNVIPIFKDFLKNIPEDYIIIGDHLKPHPSKSCGRNTLNWKFGKIMRRLYDEGKLTNIDNVSYYSFKYTGITVQLDLVSLLAVSDNARHHSPTQTLVYRRRGAVNKEIRNMDLPMD
jgi:integrase/recombinase XerD